MSGIWRSAWMALRRKALRSLLTISSIAIGTAMVVLILCIGRIGTQAIGDELGRMGVDGLSVSAEEGLSMGALDSIRSLSSVRRAMPLSLQFASAVTDGGLFSVVGCGIDSGADQVISLELLHGRMLAHTDVAAQSAVCVVDEALALEAYGRTNVVGERMTLAFPQMSAEVTIVGVSAAGSSLLQNMTALIPYMVYLPYTTQQLVTQTKGFDQIAVRLADGAVAADTEKAIRRLLQNSGEDIEGLVTENLASQRERMERVMDIVSLALVAIGGVSLLVSGFGILTVMLSSVNERTREIGIKKAIGATRTRILYEFLAGALMLGAFGALSGLIFGCGAVVLGCVLLGFSLTIPIGALVGVLVLTLLLSMLFGAYPAYRASGLHPVEALRYEG